jgi:hypothetical protein
MSGKRLLNLVSLYGIQFSNVFLPLIILPYSLSIVGAELYASIVVSEVVALIVLAVALYSYEISGPRKMLYASQAHDNLVGTILQTRLVLYIVTSNLAIISAWVLGFVNMGYLVVWLLLPLGQILQSSYFFLAREDNFPLALIVVCCRTVALLLGIVLLESSQDAWMVPALIGGSYLVSGALAQIYLLFVYRPHLTPLSVAEFRREILEGKEIFVGNVAVSLYRDVNTLILGALGSPATAIAAYSLAEKLVKGVQTIVRPLSRFFYPPALRALSLYQTPSRGSFSVLWRYSVPQMLILLFLFVAVYFSATLFEVQIASFLSFPHIDQTLQLFLVMCVAAVFGVFNYVFGSIGMNNLDAARTFAAIIVAIGCANMLICTVLSYFFSNVGAALSFLVAEALIVFFIIMNYLQVRG